jgi:pre-mRNA-processing factor 19
VASISWDYTGQFLAIAGPGCVAVQQYAKSSKAWTEPLRKALAGQAVRWGPNAGSLKVLTPEGAISTLGA